MGGEHFNRHAQHLIFMITKLYIFSTVEGTSLVLWLAQDRKNDLYARRERDSEIALYVHEDGLLQSHSIKEAGFFFIIPWRPK